MGRAQKHPTHAASLFILPLPGRRASALHGLLLGLCGGKDHLHTGVPALRIICPHFLLAGAGIVLSSVFQALGNGVFSLTVSICRQLVVLIPAAWLLSRTGEVNMVWWAFIIAEVVSLALSLVFMARINRTVIVPLSEKQDAAV